MTRDEGAHRFETLAIHAGQEPDQLTGAVTVPIYQTSTYALQAPERRGEYFYGRGGNPTRTALQTCLAALEGGAWALAFASGLGAASAVAHSLRAGDHVLLGDDVYGGTYRLFTRLLVEWGIRVTSVDFADLDRVEGAFTDATRLVWLESPTNPLLKVVDIAAVAVLAKERGALTLVDNTFASPYLQQPLELGADLVLHSTTKYVSGHSDLLGGALIGRDADLGERLRFIENATGGVPGPMDAWLILRGLKTLSVRMERHCSNARAMAAWISSHPQVSRVHYPGLPGHPQHELARRQMRDFGGMISFELHDGEQAAMRMASSLRVISLAVSLGGVESLLELPGCMTHQVLQGTEYELPPGLLRLSVGIEAVEDLIADIDQAMVSVRA